MGVPPMLLNELLRFFKRMGETPMPREFATENERKDDVAHLTVWVKFSTWSNHRCF